MPKEMILLDDVEGLGIVGDVVNVKDGFARNYLLPKRLAAPVNDKMKARLAERRAARELELAQLAEFARGIAAKLEGMEVQIASRVSNDEGHLFGSVAEQEIVDAVGAKGVKIEKKHVAMGKHIKQLGEYTVRIRLHSDVSTDIKVRVTPEK